MHCRAGKAPLDLKRKLTWAALAAILLVAGFVALKLTVPFSYAEAALRSDAVEFVKGLQEANDVAPEECAARYLYFETDYHHETPRRIRVSAKELSGNRVRVTLHDPSCQDDSIYSSINRIYLERKGDGAWIPTRHEWSHTGRGAFGWTTEPTS
jgi:hypothetical protein